MMKPHKGSSGSHKHTEHYGSGEKLGGRGPAGRGPNAQPGWLAEHVKPLISGEVTREEMGRGASRSTPKGMHTYDGEED